MEQNLYNRSSSLLLNDQYFTVVFSIDQKEIWSLFMKVMRVT